MIHEWFEWIVNKLIFRPLYKLYMLVWWHDHPDSHICTTISPGTTDAFWEKHSSECQDVIRTEFQGIYTIISCGLWFFFLHQIYLFMWHKCVVAATQRSIMRDAIRTAIREVHASGYLAGPSIVEEPPAHTTDHTEMDVDTKE